jgi:hypothetical protein
MTSHLTGAVANVKQILLNSSFANGGLLERWKTLICNKLGRKMTLEVTVSVVGSRFCALHEVKDLCWQGELGRLAQYCPLST